MSGKMVDPSDAIYRWYHAPHEDSDYWSVAQSRDHAIESGCVEAEGEAFWIIEARMAPLCDEIFDAEAVAERFADQNEEAQTEDGLESGATADQLRELERALAETHRAWRIRHGLYAGRSCDEPRVHERIEGAAIARARGEA